MKKSVHAVVAVGLVAAMPLVQPPVRAGSHDAAQHDANPAASTAHAARHHARGVVRSIDASAGTVMIAHGPIASLGWPAMAMAFRLRDHRLLGKVHVGSTVEFDFEPTNDGYLVTAIR